MESSIVAVIMGSLVALGGQNIIDYDKHINDIKAVMCEYNNGVIAKMNELNILEKELGWEGNHEAVWIREPNQKAVCNKQSV